MAVADNAFERVNQNLRTVYRERVASGEQEPQPTAEQADLSVLLLQHVHALATLEAIASGRFTSTDENPQYAGGVVSPGNRIYTPQEAATNVLQQIREIEATAPRV